MNTTTTYLVNAFLVLLVVRQIREHRLDLAALARPVIAVGVAAVLFVHTIPTRGNDLLLVLVCVCVGAVMGAVAGSATHIRNGADGSVLGRAGWLAAGLWVGGVGARMAFVFATTHGAGPAVADFSVAHSISGADAWVAALVLMALADVLVRLAVVYLRGRSLTTTCPALPAIAGPGG
jgi:hypothetical protein